MSETEATDRETLGRRVREVWVAWAREQANPKPSWLVPWEGLAEADKEVDRRIGEELYAMGAQKGSAVAVQAPKELLDEIREDLRHEGSPRCDRWFPEVEDGADVVNLNLSVGLAWWTVALPIIKQARVGSRILVLDSPRPEAIGKVGTLRSFDGFPCVDLNDGTPVRPLVRQAALLPAEAAS